ncbi:MAG TPA: hypothetical protein VH253_01975 [Phycisphaerae bacterium]|nr:hypothetical protein [Phycisphaerae bacterium]
MRKSLLPLLCLLLPLLPDCSAKKVYPDPAFGWHNNDFSTIFGRLSRITARNPSDPPVWVIRFGAPADTYAGQLALTPPDMLTGYNGGETVEVRGRVRADLAHPDYTGTWYEVSSIRLWSPHR